MSHPERAENFGPESCVSLVGMAGAGKSTLGLLLAKRLGFAHLDTDKVIEAYYGRDLQDLLDLFGPERFLDAEEMVVRQLYLRRAVVSTGGSVIYRAGAVERLKALGPVVHLDIGREAFLERVGRAENRGFVRPGGRDLGDVYAERTPLYRAAADFCVSTDHGQPEECAGRILEWLGVPA